MKIIDRGQAREYMKKIAKEKGFDSLDEYLKSLPPFTKEDYMKLMREKGYHFDGE